MNVSGMFLAGLGALIVWLGFRSQAGPVVAAGTALAAVGGGVAF